ncbi:DUF1329 domain-containing protein [Pokkaliibacter plantistimulans]|uniref:DUF1329 domain-containing protein n=1 Tax=Proteobacteria bacterium 228 TaxID=2083153 RepID=A0A2S5KRF8_9PROT|nr:DUF1329 domain-containing protein [Pokkaliibacter plantistimulans]PPC76846.1 DUF1329 domain-containing protein [Pokkaliibacter plantistimulans]
MNKYKKPLLLGSLLALAISCQTQAAVSADQAAKLGTSLTPIGAEMAGNADGSIPKWEGGLAASSGDRFADPYASDKILLTITAANVDQYKDKLSPGQVAMFKKYPDYKMNIYPSHRSAALPQRIYDAAKANATSVQLAAGGNGVTTFKEAVPFPIPQNGLEVIWNHITRYRGGTLQRTVMQAAVQANGDYSPVKLEEKFAWPAYMEDGVQDGDKNILSYFTQEVLSPARLVGNVLLVYETLNQVDQPRQAWVYNAGQRRVRRAPQVAYDAPGTATDGQRTSDNLDMYNGAPDRYDWKLIGKKEMYIPYNSFKLASRSLKYDDIVKPGHLNTDLPRYELHRVWVVEATLKPSERHIYAKREFFIDEDTWQAAVVDHYDGRDQLWRVAEAYEFQYRDAQVPWLTAEALYDLQSGRYLIGSLTNEDGNGFSFGEKFRHNDFTPDAIRRMGKR